MEFIEHTLISFVPLQVEHVVPVIEDDVEVAEEIVAEHHIYVLTVNLHGIVFKDIAANDSLAERHAKLRYECEESPVALSIAKRRIKKKLSEM